MDFWAFIHLIGKPTMAKIFLTGTFCILILAACNNREKENAMIVDYLPHIPENTKASIFHQKALDDYNKKELKYYFQSIHYANKQQIQYFKDSFQIQLISVSDFGTSKYGMYNQVVDSIVLARKGIRPTNILQALK